MFSKTATVLVAASLALGAAGHDPSHGQLQLLHRESERRELPTQFRRDEGAVLHGPEQLSRRLHRTGAPDAPPCPSSRLGL
jgi:hypothetical protein